MTASPLTLLGGRDEDPRPQSPLTYRERSFFVAAGTSEDDLELALRITLARLQEDLSERPRGQLVALAAFDHHFTSEPTRAPIATLQWKDWRGEAIFERPDSGASLAPPPDLQRTSFAPTDATSQASASAVPPRRVASQNPSPPAAKPWVPSPAAVPFTPSISPFAAASAPVAHAAAPAPVPSAFPFAAPIPVAPSGAPSPFGPAGSYPVSPAAAAAAPAPLAPSPFGAAGAFAAPSPFGAPTHPAPALIAPSHEVSAHAPMPVQVPPAARAPRSTLAYMATPLSQNADSTGEQDQRLAHAFEAVQDLYFLATPAAGLEFVIQLLGELVPSEASSASLYDINTDHLRCVAAAGNGADTRRAQAIPGNTGLLGVAVRGHRDSLIVNDVRADPRFIAGADSYADIAAREIAFFPLIVGVQLVGMLQLINRVGKPNFSEADAAVGAYVAAQAAKFVMDHRNRRDA